MKKYEDIAVIGMSGIFPKACNLMEYRELLQQGMTGMGQLPDEKRDRYGYKKQVQEKVYGFIEGEEFFDRGYFGIAKDDAKAMSPSQRKMLELTVTALEDGGYGLEEVEGKNIGLCYTISEDDYGKLLPKGSKEQITAGNGGMIVGNIAYYLGLQGRCQSINTTCTSALVAIHDGCRQLQYGECDGILAGAFHLLTFHQPDGKSTEEIMGILSEDGHTHSFGAQALGTGIGEGGGVVFLKRLRDAIQDGDPIDAVIKGSVVKYSGKACKDYRMPSETILRETAQGALNMAGIPADKVGLIEAHGTGTKIGDAIELKGLEGAYQKAAEKSCAITAVKSNIGHLENASGMASFIKAVLSVKYGERYPIALFTEPTPDYPWGKSPFFPVTTLEPWDEKQRIAAINAYAMNGSYVHMLLENYREDDARQTKPTGEHETDRERFLLTVRARSREAFSELLTRHQLALLAYGKTEWNKVQLAAYTNTANTGRSQGSYQTAIGFTNPEEGAKKLERLKEKEWTPAKRRDLILLCSGSSQPTNRPEDYLRQQFALISNLKKWGISLNMVLGCGLGNAVVKHWKDEILDWDAIKKDGEVYGKQTTCDLDRFETFIRGRKKKTDILFVTLGDGILEHCIQSKQLAKLMDISTMEGSKEQLVELLYNQGAAIDWKTYYKDSANRRNHIPVYPFQKEWCWVNEKEGHGLC